MTGAAERPVPAGVDGSESALEAVRWAAREADRRKAGLRRRDRSGQAVLRHAACPVAVVH